jgi:hypothetical protein
LHYAGVGFMNTCAGLWNDPCYFQSNWTASSFIYTHASYA